MSETKMISGVLVAFSYGVVAGSKKDKEITHEVTQEKNAGDDAGSWSNKLFPASTCGKVNTYTRLRKHLSSMRYFHYLSTFHFEESIWRILPEKRIAAYKMAMEDEGRAEANKLLDEFCEDLPALIDLAKLGRGDAFKASDYPSEAEVRSAFLYTVDYRPIPTSAGLNPALMQDAIDKLNELHARRLAEANETLVKRFMAPLQTLAEQIQDPSKRKIGQVIGTIRDFTETLPQLELSGNAELLHMAQQINSVFNSITPQLIKEDEQVRKMLGETLQTALTSLDRFGQLGQRKFAA